MSRKEPVVRSYVVLTAKCDKCGELCSMPVDLRWVESVGLMIKQSGDVYCHSCGDVNDPIDTLEAEMAFMMRTDMSSLAEAVFDHVERESKPGYAVMEKLADSIEKLSEELHNASNSAYDANQIKNILNKYFVPKRVSK